MTDKEFKAEIKKGLSGGYLLFGEEDFLKEYYIGAAKAELLGKDSDFASFNLIECDEANYSSAALADALATMPMMSDKVLCIFHVRLSKLRESEKKELYDVLQTVADNETAVLLLVACTGFFDSGNIKKNKPSALYKELSEYLTPVEFAKQTPAALRKWVIRHFEADGISATPFVADEIVKLSDGEMLSLSGEVEKLICFAKANSLSEITKETVENLCADNTSLEAFALSNAISSGNKRKALAALYECKSRRQKPQAVLAGITAEFNNMYKVAICLGEGMMKDEIAKELGMHPYKTSIYIDAVSNIAPTRFRMALERCRDADLALKSSKIDYIALERLVCTMPSRLGISGR